MPYQRARYPMMPLPQIETPDPIRTLGGLMRLSGGVRQMREAERQDKSRAAFEGAIKAAGGDLDQAADVLIGQGYWQEASLLRERKAEIRKAQQDALSAEVDRTAKGFKFSTQVLQGVEEAETPEAKASAFQMVRPEILKALPQFERDIPEQYDEQWVKAALPWGLTQAEIATKRQGIVAEANRLATEKKSLRESDEANWALLGRWVEDEDTGEGVAGALEALEKVYGASPMLRQRLGDIPPGPLTPETKTQLLARFKEEKEPRTPGSIQAAILEARAKGDQAEIGRLLKLEKEYRTAGRAPKEAEPSVSAAELEAVVANPQIWRDFTPTKRDKLFVPLTQAGFDFTQTARGLTKAEKNTIERWYSSELRRLKADPLSDTEYAEGKARLDASRRAQLGEAEPTSAPEQAAGASARPTPKVGDIVRARGQRIRVTRINADGSVAGTPVE